MYLCSGPPRTYAQSSDAADGARIEDVAVAVDPLYRVVARVTSTHVSLFAASARSRPFHSQRLLATAPRSGRFVTSAVKAREALSPLEGVADGGCTDVQQLSAVWVAGDRLAVVERGSQVVEFYAFDGLPTISGIVDPLDPAVEVESTPTHVQSPVAIAPITIRFVDEYPLNQGETPRDRDDVAWAMTGINGGKHLFVGMESGLICVVDIVDSSSSSSSTVCALWKIDVLVHLQPQDAESTAPPSCYTLTAASWDKPASRVSSLALVACFEGGKCFIMLVAPTAKRIDQLLSLVNTERGATSDGRCTAAALDANGGRLALGWADGGVSLFRLTVNSDKQPTQQLQLQPQRELSMAPWGYTPADVGGVLSLAWTLDARAIAVGYQVRGFSVFATDGGRLMSSLPHHHTATVADAELCAFGTLRLAWTAESASLLVVPRGESFNVTVELPSSSSPPPSSTVAPPPPSKRVLEIDDVCSRVEVLLLKDSDDGLCLSLSGAPGRCGAWVRSDNSFPRRADGRVGPAEASGLLRGGDLLLSLDDDASVVNLPFEQVIQKIKALQVGTQVTLVFLRLHWDVVYPIAVKALASAAFKRHHQLRALLADDEDQQDEELCIREYALRMQAAHGDCDLAARPSLLELERRAKFDGWAALQGTSASAARHKYIKLLLALFPVWSPLHILHMLVAFANQPPPAEEDDFVQLQQLRRLRATSGSPRAVPSPKGTEEHRRRSSLLALVELDFARSVPLADRHSKLVLLEDAAVRLLATPALDDPCALAAAPVWHVPAAYDAGCCPLRRVALSASGQHVALAGQRGFCLLHVATGKWRQFGNVHEEQDLHVHALTWVHEDAVLVAFSRARERHRAVHLAVYPRNHLAAEAELASLQIEDATSIVRSLETDEDRRQLFCLLQTEVVCVEVAVSGALADSSLRAALSLRRRLKLPASVAGPAASVLDFSLLPRAVHVRSSTGGAATEQEQEQEQEEEEENQTGWLASMLHRIVGGEVPNQYAPQHVLPRVALLTSGGDVVVWDPETRAQRLLLSNISTVARVFVDSAVDWPAPCRLLYGLYGRDGGLRLWLPLLDGVYLAHTKAFEADALRLASFLACHDPLRFQTLALEFGNAPPSAELFDHVLREYGIELQDFVAAAITQTKHHLPDGVANLRGCVATVDDPASQDRLLRGVDADVALLGVQRTLGLWVGVSQDVYLPPLATTPCFDVLARVQPLFHGLLALLVRNGQQQWAARVLAALRSDLALAAATHELFLHAMLEACFLGEASREQLRKAVELLRGHSDDDAYCEMVAHVARKSEPSRRPLLFPLAGDPLALVATCRQRGELHTAANFLLVLDGKSADREARTACAAALLGQCVEQDEWALARHVLRVARDWVEEEEGEEERSGGHEGGGGGSIDAQLAAFCWQDLVEGRYERVVAAVAELQAKLPLLDGVQIGLVASDVPAIEARVKEAFVETGRLQDLEALLAAVTEAQYEQWTLLLSRVLASAGRDPSAL